MKKESVYRLVGHFLGFRTKITGIFLVLAACSGIPVVSQTAKPKLHVAADGFPFGHETPEGVASDIARALINRDVTLFTGSCIRLHGGGKARDDYAKFLQDTVEKIKQEANKKIPSPYGPKSIVKIFAARHLSRSGPASYGYATFDFQDIMFVDVVLNLKNGDSAQNRTMVIKDRDGKWYVYPLPDLSPLLSQGLNDEKPSVQDFSEAYDVER
jgi:hypothetical protein